MARSLGADVSCCAAFETFVRLAEYKDCLKFHQQIFVSTSAQILRRCSIATAMYNTAIRQLNICQTTLGMLAIRNGLAVAPTYDSEECVLQSKESVCAAAACWPNSASHLVILQVRDSFFLHLVQLRRPYFSSILLFFRLRCGLLTWIHRSYKRGDNGVTSRHWKCGNPLGPPSTPLRQLSRSQSRAFRLFH